MVVLKNFLVCAILWCGLAHAQEDSSRTKTTEWLGLSQLGEVVRRAEESHFYVFKVIGKKDKDDFLVYQSEFKPRPENFESYRVNWGMDAAHYQSRKSTYEGIGYVEIWHQMFLDAGLQEVHQAVWLRLKSGKNPSVMAQDQPVDRDARFRDELSNEIYAAWRNEDFAKLESMGDQFIKPDARTPSGKRTLAVYEHALSNCVSKPPTANPDRDRDEYDHGPVVSRYPEAYKEWMPTEERLKKWQEKFPASAHATVAKALFYVNRGWYFRGSHVAKDVRPEAWTIFRHDLAEAGSLLWRTREQSQKTPIWYAVMFTVLGAQSAPQKEIDELVLQTFDKGQSFQSALQSAFNYLTPKWNGSYEAMEKFARTANQASKAFEHGELYARLYWNLTAYDQREMNSAFFSRTGASWPLMVKSFDAIVQNYPEPRNFSGYALFACMAGDSVKAFALLEKAKTLFYYDTWPQDIRKMCPKVE